MSLYERIGSDLKTSLKKGDSVRLSTLRMLLAAVKYLEIEKKTTRLEDPDILQIIQRQIKQHRDSIEQFGKGGRQDLVGKEAAELVILESYMPEQMKPDELVKIVEEAIAQAGATSRRDAGKVMKLVMEKAKGRADGKVINQLVMERLK